MPPLTTRSTPPLARAASAPKLVPNFRDEDIPTCQSLHEYGLVMSRNERTRDDGTGAVVTKNSVTVYYFSLSHTTGFSSLLRRVRYQQRQPRPCCAVLRGVGAAPRAAAATSVSLSHSQSEMRE